MPKGRFATDILGQKFNRLTVLSREETHITKSGHSVAKWLCRCDCGKTKIIAANKLKNGHTKSCGCLQIETCKQNWKNTKEVRHKSLSDKTIPNRWPSKLYKGESGFNKLYSTYKKTALMAQRDFLLSKEDFKKLTSDNCYYCNVAPYRSIMGKNLHGKYLYNGVDRLDNTKGYTLENSVTCCKICNLAKRDLSLSDFISHIMKIAKYVNEKGLIDLIE